MSPDGIICRNISFVGCILIIAATELSKILRSLFIALKWRRRCISSSISFDSYLMYIGLLELLNYCIVLSLFLNHVSSFDISPLLLRDGSPLYLRCMVQHT